MKVEVAVMGSPSVITLMVFVDVKQPCTQPALPTRAQELCESRGCRPGLPVPTTPYGFSGRKEIFEE